MGLLLAQTEGDVETVVLRDLPVELSHCRHTPVPAAGVHAAGLDRLQVRSEQQRVSLLERRRDSVPAASIPLAPVECRVTGGAKVEYLLVLETPSCSPSTLLT